MKIAKKLIIGFIFISMFLNNILIVKAAFDIGATTASYDSNSGVLTIYDAAFTNIDNQNTFSATASRMKLGNVTLSGSCKFNNGTLKIFVNNKSSVNQQSAFTTEGTVSSGLGMERGAVMHTYRPPNSINVVIDSPSNAKSMNVAVIGLRPSMKIHNFVSNVNTLEGEGDVTLRVNGENLNVASFSVYDKYTNKTHAMKVDATSATITLARPKNTSKTSREDVFVLYVNGVENYQRVSVTVNPQKTNTDSNPPSVTNPDSGNSSSNGNSNNINNGSPNAGNSNIDNPNTKNSSSDESVLGNDSEMPSNGVNTTSEDNTGDQKNEEIEVTKDKVPINKNSKVKDIKKTQNQNTWYILSGFILVGCLLAIWQWKRRKRAITKDSE